MLRHVDDDHPSIILRIQIIFMVTAKIISPKVFQLPKFKISKDFKGGPDIQKS